MASRIFRLIIKGLSVIYTTKQINHILCEAGFEIVVSKKVHFPFLGAKYKK